MNQRLEQSPVLVLARLARFKPHWAIQILLFLAVACVCLMILPGPVQLIGIILDWDTYSAAISGVHSFEDLSVALTELVFNSGLVQLFALYSFGVTLIGSIIYVRFIEHRPIASMGARKEGAIQQYFAGIGIAIALIVISLAMSVLFGLVTVTPSAITPALGGAVLIVLPAWLIQSAGEEFLYRGYLMPSLVAGRMPAVAAALVSSALFAASHLFNAGYGGVEVFQVFCLGTFLAFYILKTGSIWGACAIHGTWNFFSSNIFGESSSSSLFVITYASDTAKTTSELIACIILILLFFIMLFVSKGWYKPLSTEIISYYTAKMARQNAANLSNHDSSSFRVESQDQNDSGIQRGSISHSQVNDQDQQKLSKKNTPHNRKIKIALIALLAIVAIICFPVFLYLIGYVVGFVMS